MPTFWHPLPGPPCDDHLGRPSARLTAERTVARVKISIREKMPAQGGKANARVDFLQNPPRRRPRRDRTPRRNPLRRLDLQL